MKRSHDGHYIFLSLENGKAFFKLTTAKEYLASDEWKVREPPMRAFVKVTEAEEGGGGPLGKGDGQRVMVLGYSPPPLFVRDVSSILQLSKGTFLTPSMMFFYMTLRFVYWQALNKTRRKDERCFEEEVRRANGHARLFLHSPA